MRALCSLMGGAACVHYLAGKESINISGKCHSGLARQEISKIYASTTTSLAVLPVLQGPGESSSISDLRRLAIFDPFVAKLTKQ